MAKLTKRKALQVCYELWMWLSENPGKEKEDYPNYPMDELYFKCPCCEYALSARNTCTKCPLIKFWRSFKDHFDCPCDDNKSPRSPYQKWRYSKQPKPRSKHALTIANAAKAELDKLPPLKRNKE